MFRTMLLVICLCIVAIKHASATLVIVIQTPTSIFIGADSKLVTSDRSKTRFTCKIGIQKDVYWGEAGLTEIPETNFNVHEIISNAMSDTSNSVSSRISGFRLTISSALLDIANYVKRRDISEFTRNFVQSPALETVFIYFINGTSHVYNLNFSAFPDDTTRLKYTESDFTAVSGEAHILKLGVHQYIDHLIIPPNLTYAQAIQYALNTAIQAHPDDLGPPIALVEINQDGPHWISEGLCGSKQQ